jgi:hypothetical protein
MPQTNSIIVNNTKSILFLQTTNICRVLVPLCPNQGKPLLLLSPAIAFWLSSIQAEEKVAACSPCRAGAMEANKPSYYLFAAVFAALLLSSMAG